MFVFGVVSIALSLVLLSIFRWTSSPRRIRAARKQVVGCLLEMRLYGDEPVVLARAFSRLLQANIRWVAALLVPTAASACVFALFYPHLDAIFGIAAPSLGERLLLTAQLDAPLNSVPRLQAPPEFTIESPAVRSFVSGEVSWRLRAGGRSLSDLVLNVNGLPVTKSIDSRPGHRYRAARRVRSTLQWLRWPGESLLPPGPVISIDVAYPRRRFEVLGFAADWTGFFLAIMLITAAVSMKYVRVVL